MNSSKRSLAVLAAAVLAIVLAVQVPHPASAQGSCTVSGNGTAMNPASEKFTRTNGTGGMKISYTVSSKCLVRGAAADDNVTAVFDVKATCSDASSPGACAKMPSLGTIGPYMPSSRPCSNNQTCTVENASANTNATIPENGTEVEIFKGVASLKSLPTHGRMVTANMGQVPIIYPKGFVNEATGDSRNDTDDRQDTNATNVHFSVAFQIPPTIHVPPAACTAISSILTKAGISASIIGQIMVQLNCS